MGKIGQDVSDRFAALTAEMSGAPAGTDTPPTAPDGMDGPAIVQEYKATPKVAARRFSDINKELSDVTPKKIQARIATDRPQVPAIPIGKVPGRGQGMGM
jgi:hypothetical protein